MLMGSQQSQSIRYPRADHLSEDETKHGFLGLRALQNELCFVCFVTERCLPDFRGRRGLQTLFSDAIPKGAIRLSE
ncbi:hypothetical protein K1719_001500 [Acacia pycnantha]|nr:hypothetical protein K1719_001500 [Acacia pycnantha]